MDFASAIASADITVEFYGYFLRWSGWQVMILASLLIGYFCYLGYLMGRTRT